MKFLGKSLLILSSVVLVACNATVKLDKESVGKLLKENPTILTDAIKANPEQFITALNEAVKGAQAGQRKKQEDDEKKKLEESFNNPLTASIDKHDVVRGTKGAPLTIIEYSDFECPFCSRGYQTVLELLKKYDGKIQFVYKHLPLSFHPNAMPAAQYYEAIAMQSKDKAGKFHDELFENFSKIKSGEKFFKSVAKKLKVDMKKLAKDLDSEFVKARIKEDMDEAKKYGFQGTPGFLFNGIPVKGAYPASHFEKLVTELTKRGKLKL